MTTRQRSLTQSQIIERHLTWVWNLWRDGMRSSPWVPSFDLRGKSLVIDRHGGEGWAGHQGDRRARKLREDGIIHSELGPKGVVYFAWRDPATVAEQAALPLT